MNNYDHLLKNVIIISVILTNIIDNKTSKIITRIT